MPKPAIVITALLSFLVAACGDDVDGGSISATSGGGSGGGASNILPGVTTRFDPSAAEAIRSSEEFQASNGGFFRFLARTLSPAERIKAHVAYGHGITGSGVKIGVIDDGLFFGGPTNFSDTHNEFLVNGLTPGKVTILDASPQRSWNCTGGLPLAADCADTDHGSFVAALAAGSRSTNASNPNPDGIQGIAYDSEIYFGAFGTDIAAAFNEFTDKGVKVSNNSYSFAVKSNVSAGDLSTYFVETPSAPGETNYEIDITRFKQYMADKGFSASRAFSRIHTGTSDFGDAWVNDIASILRFQESGGVVVWANSNYGYSDRIGATPRGLLDASAFAAAPVVFPGLQGAWITVVNVAERELARGYVNANGGDFEAAEAAFGDKVSEGGYGIVSAICGEAAAFCLSMDGVQVTSADAEKTDTSSYRTSTGTSFATPQVAGAVALLRQAFPNLSSKQLVTRLFYTADNSWFAKDGTAELEYGLEHEYSTTWGHGFIDLEKALAPIGPVTVATSTGKLFPITDGDSTITTSSRSAVTSAVSRQLAKQNFLIRDLTGADFKSDLSSYLVNNRPRHVDDQIDHWQTLSELRTHRLAPDFSLDFASHQQGSASNSTAQTDNEWTLRWKASDQEVISLASGGTLDQALAFQSKKNGQNSAPQIDPAFNNPLLSLAGDSSHWGAYEIKNEDNRLTLGVFSNRETDFSSSGLLASATHRDKESGFQVQFSAGLVGEVGGILGTKTNGAFASEYSATALTRLAAQLPVNDHWSLQGAYVLSQTHAKGISGGLFSEFAPILTDSFALGLKGSTIFAEGDNLSLSLSQPLRIRSGKASLDLPTGYAAGQTYRFENRSVDLAPEAQELRSSLHYRYDFLPDAHFELGGLLVKNPDHENQSSLEYGLSTQVRLTF